MLQRELLGVENELADVSQVINRESEHPEIIVRAMEPQVWRWNCCAAADNDSDDDEDDDEDDDDDDERAGGRAAAIPPASCGASSAITHWHVIAACQPAAGPRGRAQKLGDAVRGGGARAAASRCV